MPIRRKLLVAGATLVLAGTAALAAIPLTGSLDAGAETEQADSPKRQRAQEHRTHWVELSAPSGVLAWIDHLSIANAAKYVDALRAAEQAAARSRVRRSGGSRCGGDFNCFKACTISRESHGNYGVVSSSGTYRGAWQFDQRTWQSNGGVGDPAAATPAQQDSVAYDTWQRRGNQPWGGRC